MKPPQSCGYGAEIWIAHLGRLMERAEMAMRVIGIRSNPGGPDIAEELQGSFIEEEFDFLLRFDTKLTPEQIQRALSAIRYEIEQEAA